MEKEARAARNTSLWGGMSLVAELMRGMVGHEADSLATLRGTPHTQQTTEHHADHNHGNATHNPIHE